MTTEICVRLAAGSIYVGVYEETCYKADSLAGSEIVQDERCSLPCPGDPSLFCGGTTGGTGRRRAIPSNRLLTIYRQAVSSSSSSSSSSQASQASVTRTLSLISRSNAAATYTPSVSSSSISSRKTTVSPVISELSSISGTPSPITPGPIRTIHVTKGVTVTEIVIAATVTTVTPLTAQGQHNTDRPGDENDQPYVTAQPSPEHNIKNGPIVSESQSSNTLNPSKPSPPPQDQQLSSGGLPIETSVIPAPRLCTPTSPSQSVAGHGHGPAVSTTLATEVEVTKDTEASESTHNLSPLEPGEASSIPSMISSSEAHRHQIMSWCMVVVIAGKVLLLQ
ncbi:hypothetical protein FANTH_10009 [Fusarium anthophilum]|uniref:WSC domain-containing protein n=1 Tax=Fusarium anthophilum TaxID=48485 RepID=A0A8H4Z3I1_9HYPO|nr:hypothetical protein FANTH_10009 [Fusarium anthophilum]